MKEMYVALKALIVKKEKILIIKRSSKEDVFANEWDLPGGKLKFGENPPEEIDKYKIHEEIKKLVWLRV